MRITRYAKPARTSSRTAATQRSSSLVPASGLELTERDVGRQRPAIGAGGRHGLEDVRDDEDPRRLRQLVTSQAERVAAPVELLVVGRGVVGELAERRHAARSSLVWAGCLSTSTPLPGGQVAGLVEDQVRDAELADVVQQCPRGAGRRSALGVSSSKAPIATAISATRSECLAVKGDLASITRANAPATRSSASSSTSWIRSGGSSSSTSAATSLGRARAQKLASSLERLRARGRASGSNQRPRRSRAIS